MAVETNTTHSLMSTSEYQVCKDVYDKYSFDVHLRVEPLTIDLYKDEVNSH